MHKEYIQKQQGWEGKRAGGVPPLPVPYLRTKPLKKPPIQGQKPRKNNLAKC